MSLFFERCSIGHDSNIAKQLPHLRLCRFLLKAFPPKKSTCSDWKKDLQLWSQIPKLNVKGVTQQDKSCLWWCLGSLLLMVQKSQTTTWDVENHVKFGISTTNLNWFSRRISEPSTALLGKWNHPLLVVFFLPSIRAASSRYQMASSIHYLHQKRGTTPWDLDIFFSPLEPNERSGSTWPCYFFGFLKFFEGEGLENQSYIYTLGTTPHPVTVTTRIITVHF